MKILGIDTTTKFLCLGVYDGKNIYEYNLELGRKHSVLLIPTIKRVIDALAWQIKDIDYFACGLGPGSFTGIRVGLSAIKGLSWSLKKPIIGISTLDIIARNIIETDKPIRQWFGFPYKPEGNGLSSDRQSHSQSHRAIVPIIDAKRELIYTSIYKIKNGRLKRIAPYMLLTEDEFLKKVPKNALILEDELPRARHIISLALERIKDKKFADAFSIKPIYLYPKECQIRCVTTGRRGQRLI